MGFKDAFLNKGWAGKTISRQETVERLNPLIHRHYALNHTYESAVRKLDDRQAADRLNLLQKTSRADVGKLSETVLSAGGVSYNGVDLDPDDFDVPGSDDAIVEKLTALETAFEEALVAEESVEHQIRTRAVLGAVLGNSRSRLQALRELAKSLH